MAYGRKYKKRIPRRHRRYKKRTTTGPRIPRPMQQKVFRFKRDIEQNLTLSNTAPPEGWSTVDNRIYKSLGWSLSTLGANTDFTNLFRSYRLKGARIRLYFSNTQSTVEQDSNYANSQLLIRMSPDQRGQADTLNNEYWQSICAKKYKLALNGGKPLDIYMPLVQRGEVASSTGTQTVASRPRFISTDALNVVHYGLNLSIERVDGQNFTSGYNNNQFCKMITTLYFECKGIE